MFVKIRQNKPTLRQTKFNDVKMQVMTKYLSKYFWQIFWQEKIKKNKIYSNFNKN